MIKKLIHIILMIVLLSLILTSCSQRGFGAYKNVDIKRDTNVTQLTMLPGGVLLYKVKDENKDIYISYTTYNGHISIYVVDNESIAIK